MACFAGKPPVKVNMTLDECSKSCGWPVGRQSVAVDGVPVSFLYTNLMQDGWLLCRIRN